MNATYLHGFGSLIDDLTDDDIKWKDPYEEYLEDLEEGCSEMFYDFNEDDRPVWLY